MSDGDAVCLPDPDVDVFADRLPGEHALVVAVVFQEHQDAESAVAQRDHGINKAKVRTSA